MGALDAEERLHIAEAGRDAVSLDSALRQQPAQAGRVVRQLRRPWQRLVARVQPSEQQHAEPRRQRTDVPRLDRYDEPVEKGTRTFFLGKRVRAPFFQLHRLAVEPETAR